MKKVVAVLVNIVVPALLAAAVFAAMILAYDSNDFFRSLFTGEESGAVLGSVAAGATETIAERAQFAGRVSMYICSLILALQLCCFYFGFKVTRGIDRSDALPEIKLKRFKNAGNIMDLPLYAGLFGTVSSFLVITYSPNSGKLIAYSSTLVGIIASTVLRTLVLYPAQNRNIDLEESAAIAARASGNK